MDSSALDKPRKLSQIWKPNPKDTLVDNPGSSGLTLAVKALILTDIQPSQATLSSKPHPPPLPNTSASSAIEIALSEPIPVDVHSPPVDGPPSTLAMLLPSVPVDTSVPIQTPLIAVPPSSLALLIPSVSVDTSVSVQSPPIALPTSILIALSVPLMVAYSMNQFQILYHVWILPTPGRLLQNPLQPKALLLSELL